MENVPTELVQIILCSMRVSDILKFVARIPSSKLLPHLLRPKGLYSCMQVCKRWHPIANEAMKAIENITFLLADQTNTTSHMRLVKLKERGPPIQISYPSKERCYAIALASDYNLVITGGTSKTIVYWDIKGEIPNVVATEEVGDEVVCLSIGGSTLASGAYADGITLHSLDTFKRLAHFPIGATTVYSLCFLSDHTRILAGSNNGCRLFSTSTQQLVKTYLSTGYVYNLKPVLDETQVCVFAATSITFFDLNTAEPLRKVVSEGDAQIYRGLITADEKLVIAGYSKFYIRIFDFQTMDLIAQLDGHHNSVNRLQLASNDNLLISSSWDHSTLVWLMHAWKRIRTFSFPGSILVLPPKGSV